MIFDMTRHAGGGTTITDGIVVTARDSNGYITECDYYNADGEIGPFQFGNGYSTALNCGYRFLQAVNLQDAAYTVRSNAFQNCGNLSDLDFSKITSIPGGTDNNQGTGNQFAGNAFTSVDAPNLTGSIPCMCFYGCSALATVYLPKVTYLHGQNNAVRGAFSGVHALTSCEVGSVGVTVTGVHKDAFNGTTQSGLTITIYTTGDRADTIAANVRNGATNATIIIKASEATTYGGVSYAAGDTILTSNP